MAWQAFLNPNANTSFQHTFPSTFDEPFQFTQSKLSSQAILNNFRTSNEFVLWKIIKTKVHLIGSFWTESLSDYQIKQIRPKKFPKPKE